MNHKLDLPRILVVGCGDIGMRILPLICRRYRIFALAHREARCHALRSAGAIPILGDLDNAASLHRLANLAPTVVHLAPPGNFDPGDLRDRRTRRLVYALGRVERLVYVSTTGVYGDCGDHGANPRFDETRSISPQTTRAFRRADAERALRRWAKMSGASVSIIRVPGIYADDRLPLERLRAGTPALIDRDDVFTNHIHADDLARIIIDAIDRGAPQRSYHASDDSDLKMADYFDQVADAFRLPRPRREPRETLMRQVSPATGSFMSESRRLRNDRIKLELGSRLSYPTVEAGLNAAVKTSRST